MATAKKKKNKAATEPKVKAKVKAKAKATAKAKVKAKAKATPAVKTKKARSLLPEEKKLLAATVTDPDALLVYADWLEMKAETARAEIVRLHHSILTRGGGEKASVDPPAQPPPPSKKAKKVKARWGETAASRKKYEKLTETERAVIDDGVQLMSSFVALEESEGTGDGLRAWAEQLSAHAPFFGTHWHGVESDKTLKNLHFKPTKKSWKNTQAKENDPIKDKRRRPIHPQPSAWTPSKALTNHLLSYQSGSSKYSNAVWRQLGSVLTFNFNQGYAHYVAVVVGADRIVGAAHNRNDHKWTFREALVNVNDVDADADADTTESIDV